MPPRHDNRPLRPGTVGVLNPADLPLECAAARVGSAHAQTRSVPIPQEGGSYGWRQSVPQARNFLDSTAGLWVTTLAGVGVIVGIVIHFFSA